MEGAEKELERRSKFLNSLIQQKKKGIQQHEELDNDNSNSLNIHVRACDMPLPLQNRAFQCACDHLDSMPAKKIDSKRLALALKKILILVLTLGQLGEHLWNVYGCLLPELVYVSLSF
ncbi:hypothetical protein SESBI_15917 [Sesbania bispinosa]|nr:hypothetical protein SESBI_15917 [Sesbania bispinosa]